MTRILFATDLHGNSAAYRDLCAAAVRREVDAVVLGGDLLPHAGRRDEPVATQRRYVEEVLGPAFATLRRRRSACRVFAILGNDDLAAVTPRFEALESAGLLALVHARAVPLDERWTVAGLSYVPLTPFLLSDFDRIDHPGWRPAIEKSAVLLSSEQGLRAGEAAELLARPTIAAELDALARCSDPARTVYVVHTPPWQTALDHLHDGGRAGSPALRRFIERYQPPLTLHGHIHESPRRSGRILDTMGRTVSVNPGASLGTLHAVVLEVEDPIHTLEEVGPGG